MIDVIIDTDPGIDDAAALAVALFHEEINVKLITTVAGNVSLDKTTRNTIKLLEFWNKGIPVAKGAIKPLIKPLEDASRTHGESGLDGYEFPEPKRIPIELHAVEAMKKTILDNNEPITLISIGPLTNVALLFSTYPECMNNIKRIVMMGGSASRGNRTPAAEFNVYVDPEAAKIVFQSGVKIVMCGLDVTNAAVIKKKDLEYIKNLNRTGTMLYSLFQHYRDGSFESGLRMHDICAVAYLVRPDIFETQECFVDVEISSIYSSGYTVVDLLNRYDRPVNTTVCLEIDTLKFVRWMIERLEKAV